MIASKKAFTLIELMIAIVIFVLGLIAAYSLIRTATYLSVRSRDEIIGGNLLRERLELVKNLRDSNWLNFRFYNALPLEFVEYDCPSSACKLDDGFYTIENRFASSGPSFILKKLPTEPDRALIVQEANQPSADTFRLCLDEKSRYVHDCGGTNKKTPYFAYIEVMPLTEKDASGTDIVVASAKVIRGVFVSIDAGYREFEMQTILTDWKR